ncbi:MAG: DUF58 domain-containing protein [Lentisphaerales bacterium]|nr:DUF58 domain-containing protein [Lentisphaerales bacterium]
MLTALSAEKGFIWLVLIYVIVLLVDRHISKNVDFSIVRSINHTLPVGVKSPVQLEITNKSDWLQKFEVIDHYPASMSALKLPREIELNYGQHAYIDYTIIPNSRGEFNFEKTEIKLKSKFGFWDIYRQFDVQSSIKVYPNYAEVVKYGLLAAEQRLAQMGILKQRKRGEGTDFNQLREYRQGDRLNRVDWKATSRIQKVIAKDYQQEQDQQIFFLLDCGRNMRAHDGQLSHFDNALNAMLLLTYVAVRQGDAVGLMTFAGKKRWLKPQKSIGNVKRLLNAVYDIQPSQDPPDYLTAATESLTLLKKRALVVVISNLREEASEDLTRALKIIGKRHLIVFAGMRENSLDETLNKEINTTEDALNYCAVSKYFKQRTEIFNKLSKQKVMAVDTLPQELPAKLVNKYLEVKGRGFL